MEFNARGLSMLAPLDEPVYVQRMWIVFISIAAVSQPSLLHTDADMKTDNDPESMLERGTLQDLIDYVQDNSPVSLNVLDLPQGRSAVDIPPMFADLATDTYTVPYVKKLVKLRDLRDVLSWATAATNGAVSWFHVDDDGFCTVVFVQAGAKWWVLADRIQEDPLHDDMGDIGAFDGWGVRDIDAERWTLEVVHLQPKSVLYVLFPITYFLG